MLTPAPPDSTLLLIIGVLCLIAGLVSRARPRRFPGRSRGAAAALVGAVACVFCGAIAIAADPATLMTTPVALAVSLGVLDAALAGVSLAAERRWTRRRTQRRPAAYSMRPRPGSPPKLNISLRS
jgi:peptidoglycan/LPS O-acetylase OafA/YrhL